MIPWPLKPSQQLRIRVIQSSGYQFSTGPKFGPRNSAGWLAHSVASKLTCEQIFQQNQTESKAKFRPFFFVQMLA